MKNKDDRLLVKQNHQSFYHFIFLWNSIESENFVNFSDAVVRTSYYKYFHPKEVYVSNGILNR